METVRRFVLPVSNLHADWPALEIWLDAREEELARLEEALETRFPSLVETCRTLTKDSALEWQPPPPGPTAAASLLAELVLHFQRAAGHSLRDSQVMPPREDAAIRFVLAYDDSDIAFRCTDLAVRVIDGWMLKRPLQAEVLDEFHAAFRQIRADAVKRATPRDAWALISAARRRGIPWYRMDREPFDPVEGDFRLRPNGLLRFGHGMHRLTLDGVFCVERLGRWHGLVRSRLARLDWLRQSGLPFHDTQAKVCLSAARVRRLARSIGRPVWLAPVFGSGLIDMWSQPDDERLDEVAARLTTRGAEMLAGAVPSEPGLELLWVDGLVHGVRPEQSGGSVGSDIDATPCLKEICGRLAALSGSECFSVALVKDHERWKIADFDLNPRLDHYCRDPSSLERAADGVMNWLYPQGQNGRIPIMAITGTNGKTTTCYMVESILRAAGYRVGLASSLGSRIDGETVSKLEDGYLPGHLTVLGNDQIEAAVLESTRGGARSVGLGFDFCSYSACTNVASDHLNDELGLRSLDELAELKCWIALRAREGMVLNYDDPYTRDMMKRIGDLPLTVVSVDQPVLELRSQVPGAIAYCTVETRQAQEWIVLSDLNESRALLPVGDIPLGLGGAARHNISNAAHAVGLCAAFGIADDAIKSGLQALKAEFEVLPGRLNLYQVADFFLLFDYAHNPHGVGALMETVDRLQVRGQKSLSFAVSGLRSDDFAGQVADQVAGRFHSYLCTNYRATYHRHPSEVPGLLEQRLLERGVDDWRISVIEDADAALAAALGSARAGDLLVCLVGKALRDQWKIVEQFGRLQAVSIDAFAQASARDGNA